MRNKASHCSYRILKFAPSRSMLIHHLHCDRRVKFTCEDKQIYKKWTKELKKTLRPQWADPDVDKCYICDNNFGIMLR